jgi:hypothetical protein
MVPNKSLDENEIIAALLCDAHASNGDVFNTRSLRLTLRKVNHRYRSEGIGFLTKTLPRLGKHFDQVLAGTTKLNCKAYGFETIRNTELPRFLGEFFSKVLQPNGEVLSDPDANCVRWIRLILNPFGKYKLPYTDDQEHTVVSAFVNAEHDLSTMSSWFAAMRAGVDEDCRSKRRDIQCGYASHILACTTNKDALCRSVVREARILLSRLFESFDPTDIIPRHGPGAVATKQQLSEKFLWTNISSRITNKYPLDAYFCASPGHVCDSYDKFHLIKDESLPARVILVPKDSRGPRLISCEPVDFQWVQQGLSQAIVRRVETAELTKFNVFFTDQGPNRRGALLGSSTNRYSTLDLKEASDRVHIDLVRLLFPEFLVEYLEACRSSSTVLPDGKELQLSKFAPMGSALCFPVMALTIWALLTASAPNADTRESILVYGDDVIVPTAFAESAMAVLESFGLKINRDKSCIQGFFKESCGMDAFKGVDVTPVRLRTVWAESPRPDVYSSWIAYANAFWDRRLYNTYEYIVTRLEAIYGPIPGDDISFKRYPSLRVSHANRGLFKRRTNKNLQKVQYKVRVVKSPSVDQVIDGWLMLLRFFTESTKPTSTHADKRLEGLEDRFDPLAPFSVSQYTKRHTSMLVWRWR